MLQQRVNDNPYDTEAWQMLVDELWRLRELPGMMDKLLEILNAVVMKFPSAVSPINFTAPDALFLTYTQV
jgi:hypothetical protein